MNNDPILQTLTAERDRLTAIIADIEPTKDRLTVIEQAIAVVSGEIRLAPKPIARPELVVSAPVAAPTSKRSYGVADFVREQLRAAGPDGITASAMNVLVRGKFAGASGSAAWTKLGNLEKSGEAIKNPRTGAYAATSTLRIAA